MNSLTKISKLMLSAAALLLAISAFVFVLKYDTQSAHAVAVYKERGLMFHNVYTQSADGKTLYRWYFNKQGKRWERKAFSQAGR